jgi:hypothetical protein
VTALLGGPLVQPTATVSRTPAASPCLTFMPMSSAALSRPVLVAEAHRDGHAPR